MAQDDNEQESGQPEPQPTGSGYVSLDQARAIALDHARENRDIYGRRYRRKDLVWEVVNLEEREDAYRVRLTYQPSRGFRGEAGVEEYTIEKTGPVRSRQIISEPVKRGGFLGCGLMSLALASALALLALLSLL
ncbi:MAG: hypothetical protein IH962_01545 [Chloroflexi bacterium]|nr:hypothetical protein [Chloroflexota bacterium]